MKKHFSIIACLFLVLSSFLVSCGDSKNDPYNGHEYVDLGLPSGIKWATCNVGATKPGDYGNYYAWGETSTKNNYIYANSTTYDKQMSSIDGNRNYDVASKEWGGTWRLPTKAEFKELIDNCTWTWTNQNGHKGYEVTSKKNGNSIFLPAAGGRLGTSYDFQGTYGRYWSATPYEKDTYRAYHLKFGRAGGDVSLSGRDDGITVRPVSK